MARRRGTPTRAPGAARWLAPVAFLLGITIAVLLVRSGLDAGRSGTTSTTLSTGPVKHATTARVPPPATTIRKSGAKPGATTTVAGAQYYTVQSGDTFGSIAAKFSTTVAQLETLNPGVSTNALQVGQKIRVK